VLTSRTTPATAKLETVRDAVCLVLEAIEPGLVEKAPVQ
jgi:hypothetical protein